MKLKELKDKIKEHPTYVKYYYKYHIWKNRKEIEKVKVKKRFDYIDRQLELTLRNQLQLFKNQELMLVEIKKKLGGDVSGIQSR